MAPNHVSPTVPGLSLQSEQEMMAELYPSPAPEVQRKSARELRLSITGIKHEPGMTDDERLPHLHRMLELCAVELGREVRAYLAAHRKLVEDEGKLREVIKCQKPPEYILRMWEDSVDDSMSADRRRITKSVNNIKSLYKVMSFAEKAVTKAQERMFAESFRKWHDGNPGRVEDDAGPVDEGYNDEVDNNVFQEFMRSLGGQQPRPTPEPGQM
ncbi:MAG: hypothetical protein Q9218_000549 [Villophora microphyllina]